MNAPRQSAPVQRGVARYQMGGATQSGCNWFKCAAHIPGCIAACTTGGPVACATCLGSAYDSCKDCF